jgi:hypothetical protein
MNTNFKLTALRLPFPSSTQEVLAVELQEVERVQHRLSDGPTPMQGVEHRNPIRTTDAGLAVQRERCRPELHRRHRYCRIAVAPRLGVETTTRNDLTARSATKPRSRSFSGQGQSARPDRCGLEKVRQPGPRMGSSPRSRTVKSQMGQYRGQTWEPIDTQRNPRKS